MRMLLLAALLSSTAARADSPRPVRRPQERATAPDDLAGTWIVQMHARITSCPAPIQERAMETWTIDYTTGAFAVRGGAMEFAGPASASKTSASRHHLNAKQRPTDGALELSQFFKDRFTGTLVRSDPAGKRDTCVTLVEVNGSRAP